MIWLFGYLVNRLIGYLLRTYDKLKIQANFFYTKKIEYGLNKSPNKQLNNWKSFK